VAIGDVCAPVYARIQQTCAGAGVGANQQISAAPALSAPCVSPGRRGLSHGRFSP